MSGGKTRGIAIIGCGARAQVLVSLLLEQGDVKVVAVYDPDPDAVKTACTLWQTDETAAAQSAEAAINNDDVSWVLVCSPNALHKEHILCAFKHGKPVFTEKPLATSIADCQEIYKAHQASGLAFATGFVLRYAPLYQRAKELLASGDFGHILSIDANENIPPAHGGYIMRNWRRHAALSGPHILEKCCHDLDLINWLCQSLPTRVAAFASNDFFTPGNKDLMGKYPEATFTIWPDPKASGSPFTSDKDLKDTHACILQYRSGAKVTFQATMSNARPERRMYLSCTEGTLVLELYSGTLIWQRLSDLEATHEGFPGGGHGGGDAYIIAALADTMRDGTPPLCSANEGLESAVTALALDDAATQGTVVDLEPIWKKLNR